LNNGIVVDLVTCLESEVSTNIQWLQFRIRVLQVSNT